MALWIDPSANAAFHIRRSRCCAGCDGTAPGLPLTHRCLVRAHTRAKPAVLDLQRPGLCETRTLRWSKPDANSRSLWRGKLLPAEVKGPEADQGGLEMAHPFSLRDQWFESISLQRRVIQTSSSTHRPIRRDGSEGQAAFVGTFARLTQHETTIMPLQRPVVDQSSRSL